MKLNAYIAAAAATVAVGGGIAAVALTSNGAVADAPPPVRIAQAPSQTLPEAVQQALHRPDSVVAEFGLDSDAARQAVLPSGRKVWITPGKRGTCLWDANATGSCATTREFSEGRLMLLDLPPIEGRITPGGSAPKLAAGPLSVIGYAPDDVDDISVVAPNGVQVANTQPTQGLYEVTVERSANWRPGAGWEVLFASDGQRVGRLGL